jgi:hypothetical protein
MNKQVVLFVLLLSLSGVVAFTGGCHAFNYVYVGIPPGGYASVNIPASMCDCDNLVTLNFGPTISDAIGASASCSGAPMSICTTMGGVFSWLGDWTGGGGSYFRNYDCAIGVKANCGYTLSNGTSVSVPHGFSRIFYKSQTVTAPQQCEFVEKVCSDGVWTSSHPTPASYSQTTCSMSVPCNCSVYQDTSIGVTACIDNCAYMNNDVIVSAVGVSYGVHTSQSIAQPSVRWKPYNSASFSSNSLLFQSLIGLTPAITFSSPDQAVFDVTYCGDGVVQGSEQCDDPSSQTCSVDCKIVAPQPWCDSRIATLSEIWQLKTGVTIPQLKVPNIKGQISTWCSLLGFPYAVAVDGTVLNSCAPLSNFKRLDGTSTLVDVSPCSPTIGPEYITSVKCQSYPVGSCKEQKSQCDANPLMCVTGASKNCKQVGSSGCDIFDLSYAQKWYAYNCSLSNCGNTQYQIITGGQGWG